jgi:hypothetical protein
MLFLQFIFLLDERGIRGTKILHVTVVLYAYRFCLGTLLVPHKVRDQVLLDKPGLLRLSTQPRTGPHTVTKIYQNSTVQLKRGAITERVTLRCLTPYFS